MEDYRVKKLTKEQRHEIAMKFSEPCMKPVIQLSFSGKEIARYKSQSEASRVTGVARNKISMCCCEKRYTAGGYRWKFEKE